MVDDDGIFPSDVMSWLKLFMIMVVSFPNRRFERLSLVIPF